MSDQSDNEREPFVDVDKAAEVTEYSVNTIRKYTQRRIIPFYQSSPGAPLRFRVSELLEWKRRRTEPKQVVPLDVVA